jgi:ribosome-binding ATPase YchF (GTP1/OBG family)
MSLEIGIVGLPNSGKSTLFNALLKRQQALVGNYPFTTIEPNVGIVEVPDDDLIALVDLVNPEKVVPATVKFIDIAGLVKDAHQGEGLGNKFLAKIREVDAIVHIIRGFEAADVPHFYGNIDPKRDKEIVDLELELAGIKKPTLYVLNINRFTDYELRITDLLLINAKTGEGVDQLIKAAYSLLGLITFYTIKGGKEVTAWSLKPGSTALEAAAKVHTDMAKGFIKAEVIPVGELLKIGGWTKAKALGKIALVGKDYIIKDKEVVEFKFNL